MHLQRALWATAVILAAFFFVGAAHAQAVTQAGPILNNGGHAPMYMPGAPQGLATVMDSGPAAGGGPGYGLSETLQINRAPGTGPFGTHNCDYDSPTTGSGFTGAHYLCFDSNVGGNGTIAYGALGSASPGVLTCIINGVSQPCLGNQVQGLPSVSGNATLSALSSNYAPLVVREDFQPGFGAPPVFFKSSASPCSVNDGGSCVSASGGGSWVGLYGSTIDVRDFGAIANGSTDSSGAINAALAFAGPASGGLCVLLPHTASPFLVSTSTIMVNGGCLTETAGGTVGLLLASGASFPLVTTAGSNAEVSNVIADANGNAPDAFFFGTSTNATLRNVVAKNSIGDPASSAGVDFGSSTGGRLLNSYITGNDEGTGGSGPTGALIQGNTFTGNIYHDIGGYLFYHTRVLGNWVNEPVQGQTNLITFYSQNKDIEVADNIIQTPGFSVAPDAGYVVDCVRLAGTQVNIHGNQCSGGGITVQGAGYDTYGGSVTVTSGSYTVTGSGTNFNGPNNNYYQNCTVASCYFYGPDDVQHTILQFDGPTSLELVTPYTGSTITSSSWKIFGAQASDGVIISHNTIMNIPATPSDPHLGSTHGIQVLSANDLTIDGNEITTNDLPRRSIELQGVGNVIMGPNHTEGATAVDSSSAALELDGLYGYGYGTPAGDCGTGPSGTCGTIAVTNGSAAVVGSGTAWSHQIPHSGTAYLQVFNSGVPPIAVASVTDDTHLTLASPYAASTPGCSATASCQYTIAFQVNDNITLTGGTYNGQNGIVLRDFDGVSASGFSVFSANLSYNTLIAQDVFYNGYFQSCVLLFAGTMGNGLYDNCATLGSAPP